MTAKQEESKLAAAYNSWLRQHDSVVPQSKIMTPGDWVMKEQDCDINGDGQTEVLWYKYEAATEQPRTGLGVAADKSGKKFVYSSSLVDPAGAILVADVCPAIKGDEIVQIDLATGPTGKKQWQISVQAWHAEAGRYEIIWPPLAKEVLPGDKKLVDVLPALAKSLAKYCSSGSAFAAKAKPVAKATGGFSQAEICKKLTSAKKEWDELTDELHARTLKNLGAINLSRDINSDGKTETVRYIRDTGCSYVVYVNIDQGDSRLFSAGCDGWSMCFFADAMPDTPGKEAIVLTQERSYLTAKEQAAQIKLLKGPSSLKAKGISIDTKGKASIAVADDGPYVLKVEVWYSTGTGKKYERLMPFETKRKYFWNSLSGALNEIAGEIQSINNGL